MKKYIGIIITVIYFVVQAISLPHVGMTWDEPSSFFFGRASLHFYQTGDRGYLNDANYKDPKRFGKDPFQYIYGEDVYPPFPFIIASLTSSIFAEKLHLMNPITAHHLGLVLIGAIGVFAMYGIGIALGWSEILAGGIALLYATYPTIIAQMRDDAKDVPVMSMIVLFVFMSLKFLFSLKKGGKENFLWAIGTGIGMGLAIGSKPTAGIMLPIFALWFFFSYGLFSSFRKKIGALPKLIPPLFFIAIIGLFVYFLTWPWLWDDPVGKITQVWTFFKVVGRGMPTLYLGQVYNAGINLPWHYPLVVLVTQTPLSVLFVGGVSLFIPLWLLIKRKDPIALLFLIWILIGMGRFFVPGVLIYAKVRHFIDVMPAFFILIGFLLHELRFLKPESLIPKLESLKLGKKIVLGFLTIMLLEQTWIILTHFPYEPSYFNAFIGGTKTVAEKRLFDIEYWASGVKDAMNYIDSVTPADHPATVYACTMAHLALFYETPKVTVTSNSVGATYTLVPNSASWFGGVAAFMKENHELAYTVKRAGGDLFWVFKAKSFSGWNCGPETNMVYER